MRFILILLSLSAAATASADWNSCLQKLVRGPARASKGDPQNLEFLKSYLEQQKQLGHKAIVIELDPLIQRRDSFKSQQTSNGEVLKYGASAFDQTGKAINPSLQALRAFCLDNGYRFDLLAYIPGGFLSGWKLKYDFATGQWVAVDDVLQFMQNTSSLDDLYRRTSGRFDLLITL